MNITLIIVSILLTTIIIDGIWLGVFGSRIYAPLMGTLMRSGGVSWLPVVMWYPLYSVGVANFVVQPALAYGWGYGYTLGIAALFGLVVYGAYDLTNQATLRDWKWKLTVIDMLWGTALTIVVVAIVYRIFV